MAGRGARLPTAVTDQSLRGLGLGADWEGASELTRGKDAATSTSGASCLTGVGEAGWMGASRTRRQLPLAHRVRNVGRAQPASVLRKFVSIASMNLLVVRWGCLGPTRIARSLVI